MTGNDTDGTASMRRARLYRRVAQRLGVPGACAWEAEEGPPTAATLAAQAAWLRRAAEAERQLGLAGSWAHDRNRLQALRQAHALALELMLERAGETAAGAADAPATAGTVSPSREPCPGEHAGRAH